MALDLEAVRRKVNVDEPDYPTLAAALGEEAVPQLRRLVDEDNAAVASKAAYILSLLPSRESLEGLQAAARSRHGSVRVAAAGALGNTGNLASPPGSGVSPATAEDALRGLLADNDPGVRKVALRSARALRSPALRAAVEQMSRADPEAHLRTAAQDALPELR
jgi:HEAT repeat protein